ncbi:autotransporter domain-containing protein [Sebaldella sp. S0638]|uniref:autotransporter domain-containing protein n=1 Tax=Sebaldella sp. S0638 TaxID=2957809 RepID=UPI0020A18426|nr:autotransporter domain-containing protein [Sebaldella sp. S0638]MCP1224273.1 autotransporter domain-containing protein [Sebaldella sp. S0638]
MRRNEKLLLSFLALNAAVSMNASAAENQLTAKYDRLYESMIKNIKSGKSNDKAYQLLERTLNQRNKELKDLYLQSDFVVKPEYLEWQIFFSGFYTEQNRGDNTLENAEFYSKPKTHSSAIKQNQEAYDRMEAELRNTGLLSASQLESIMGGYYNVINELDVQNQEIIRNILDNGLKYITKIDGFKSYQSPQKPKEIDLGINITPKVINRNPLNPAPSIPAEPNIVLPDFTPDVPVSPTVPTLTIKAFNPVSPVPVVPNTTTPPNLTFIPTGFGQDQMYIIQNSSGQGIMFGNQEEIEAVGTVNVSAGSTTSFTGTINYIQGGTPLSLTNGAYGSVTNAFYSMVNNSDVNIKGNFNIQNTDTFSSNTYRFISYNPYNVTSQGIKVDFSGTMDLNGKTTGNSVLVGVEHQLLYGNGSGTSPAMLTGYSTFENTGTINLASGTQVIGIMVDSEGTQSPYKSYTINSGTINVNNTESIGIDFGAYVGNPAMGGTYAAGDLNGKPYTGHPNVEVRPGNINVNGSLNYGLRVQDLSNSPDSWYGGVLGADYYEYAEIDGSNGIITVAGTNNVGVSFSQKIATAASTDPIGNVRNLRVVLDGTNGVGVLRRGDYLNTQTEDMVLGSTHLSLLEFDDNATGGVLIRSDFKTVALDRDLTISKGNGNNTVMQSNGTDTLIRLNTGKTININSGIDTVTGMLASNNGSLTNNGTINLGAENSQGIAVLSGSSGLNTGTINSSGNNSVGIYNEGTFSMTGGTVDISSNKGIGLYTKDNTVSTTISGGTIISSNGAIGLYADGPNSAGGATVNLTGTANLVANSGGLMLYNYSSAGDAVGKFNVTGTVNAAVNSNGTAFYFKGVPAGINAFLTNMITGSGKLNIKLTDSTSSLFVLDNPGSIINLSDATPEGIAGSLPSTVTIDASSNPNYKPYSVFKGGLNIDLNVNIDNGNDAYNRSEFISSKVELLSGKTMTGTLAGQYAIGQESYLGNTGRNDITINVNNGSKINMSGTGSVGIVVNYGEVLNNGEISAVGSDSIGVVAYNGSFIRNNGKITVGAGGVGIYGENKVNPDYGNGKIEIENDGIINSIAATGGRSYGVFANNTETSVSRADSTVKLFSNSNIDMSAQTGGIGVSAKKSTITNDGKITVGKDGIAFYTEDSEVTINGGEINLKGDGVVGFYMTDSILNGNSGTINIDGKNIVLFHMLNSTFTNNLTINAAAGSSYIIGNMTNTTYTYTGTQSLGSGSTLLNGIDSAILFDSSANISSAGTGVVALLLNGQYTGGFVSPYSVEGENKGTISLGNDSAAIYGKNGARLSNTGTISVGESSVGLYALGSGADVKNTGTINIGKNSTGLYLRGGQDIVNNNIIAGAGSGSIGMYTDSNTGIVENNNAIDLSGDKVIGIYSVNGTQNIVNNGTIKIGNSGSTDDPGIGIYTKSLTDTIVNNGTIETGTKALGIYSLGTSVTQNGIIKVGDEGTGIYKEQGILDINNGAQILIGNNEAVGLYAVNNATVNIRPTAVMSIGSGSYGTILENGSSLWNQAAVTLSDNSIFTYGNKASSIINDGQINMTGSDNTAFYMVKAGSILNNANITGTAGTGNIGIYNRGIYAVEELQGDLMKLEGLQTEGVIINDADITLGNSNLIDMGNGQKTGYSVGIYAEGATVENKAGRTITVGEDGVGMYAKDAFTASYNYGTIIGNGNRAIGVFADNTRVENHGKIIMTGDDVIGMAGRNGAQIYNAASGEIYVTGKNVTGIYLAGGTTTVENHGKIIITNTGGADENGVGIRYTSDFNTSNIIGGAGNISGTGYVETGFTSKSYELPELPTLINSGEIIIDVANKFSYENMKVIVKVDPSTNQATTNASSQVGFGGSTIPDKLEITPDFSQGTSADRYVLQNIFRGLDGKGQYISQSLTWDATGQGSDIVMTRISYDKFTDGLWYEDFGRILNEKYAGQTGDGLKVFDKIDMIQSEPEFRHAMASLAGNVYANINQREADIASIFSNSNDLMQNSGNNTKENLKINVIAGRGRTNEDTDGVVPYDYTTAGVLALREVERTYRHTFGYSLGYLHTGFEFKDDNKSEEWVDTIQLGLHNKYETNGWKLRNDLTGRVSLHNIDRNIDWPSPVGRSEMNGTYETYSVTLDNIIGKEIPVGKKFSVTPYGAFKAMYVTRPTFSESGLERLEVEGNDAWSAKPRAGVELKTSVPLGSKSAWELKGALDLAYEYELAGLNEREYAKLIAVEDDYHKLSKPEEEKGTFRARASVGVEVTDRYGVFVTGEYGVGNKDQDDYKVGITLKAVF